MAEKAVVITRGRIQYVTIPPAFHFRSSVVSIRRDAQTGDVILSEIPPLDEVFAALDAAQIPEGFLNEADHDQAPDNQRRWAPDQ